MSVWCVGQAVLDFTVSLGEDIQPNRKYRLGEHLECAGGPALNAACVCGKWGAESALCARVGDDDRGRKVLASLDRFGVSTEHVQVLPQVETPWSFIVANPASGGRTIFNFPLVGEALDLGSAAGEPDVILSDGHEPEATLQLVSAHPRAKTVVDAGTCRESTLRTAEAVEHLVCSEDFARQYLGRPVALGSDDDLRQDLVSLRRINQGRVAVTLGAKGLVYLDEDGEARRMPAFPARAVDSTGAGDIFHGAYAFALDRGLDMREALLLASMTASISVTRAGSQTSIPALPEVLSALDEAGHHIEVEPARS